MHDEGGIVRKIRLIAETIGVDGEGLAKAVAADFATLAEIRARITAHRKAVFVLALGGGTPIVAGKGTSAEAIMTLAGADNALTGMVGFKPAVAEATLAAEPDAVVIMADRDHTMSPDSLFALPAFAGTPAARPRRLIGLPGLYLLGFGPRTAHAARDLAAALYPELRLPTLPGRPWTGRYRGEQGGARGMPSTAAAAPAAEKRRHRHRRRRRALADRACGLAHGRAGAGFAWTAPS